MARAALTLAAVLTCGLSARADSDLESLERQFAEPRADRRYRALHRVGEFGRAAVPVLRRALADPEPWVRFRALEEITRVGVEALDALPETRRLRGDTNEPTRLRAVGALAALGRAAEPDLGRQLVRGDRATADAVLGHLESDPAAALRLADAVASRLGDANDEIHIRAAVLLLRCDPSRGGDAADLLVHEWERYTLAPGGIRGLSRLTGIGPSGAPLVPHLRRLVRARGPLGEAAMRIAGEIGPPARSCAESIADLLDRSQDSAVRTDAARTLGRLLRGATAAEARRGVGSLSRVVSARWRPETQEAVQALGEIGTGAAGAIPALVTAANRSDGAFACDALWSLSRIEPARAAECARSLEQVLLSDDEGSRGRAAFALGNLGEAARAALPLLRATLRTSRGSPGRFRAVGADAAFALMRLDPAVGVGAVEAVAAALDDGGITMSRVRSQVEKGGGRLSECLRGCVRHRDPAVRLLVLRTAAATFPAPDALRMCREALASPDSEVREAAAESLRELGAAAAPALPELRRLQLEDAGVRRAAAKAIRTITQARDAESP